MRRRLPWGAAAVLAALGGVLQAGDFEVRIGLANAHLLEVFFGCSANATAGYDRDVDQFAPPPGIATGFVGFLPPAGLPLFYKDIRGPGGPQEWRLSVRAATDRPVRLSWDPKALPAGWAFTITQAERTVSMAETAALAVNGTATLAIRAAPTPANTPPQKQVQAP